MIIDVPYMMGLAVIPDGVILTKADRDVVRLMTLVMVTVTVN